MKYPFFVMEGNCTLLALCSSIFPSLSHTRLIYEKGVDTLSRIMSASIKRPKDHDIFRLNSYSIQILISFNLSTANFFQQMPLTN